jgi:hypothetical protein
VATNPVLLLNQYIYVLLSKIINHLAPQWGVGVVAAWEKFIMNSEQARQQAEKRFRQEGRGRDGRKAMAEYEAEARATREKTARLKALRSAKEAQAGKEPGSPKLAERQPPRRRK